MTSLSPSPVTSRVSADQAAIAELSTNAALIQPHLLPPEDWTKVRLMAVPVRACVPTVPAQQAGNEPQKRGRLFGRIVVIDGRWFIAYGQAIWQQAIADGNEYWIARVYVP